MDIRSQSKYSRDTSAGVGNRDEFPEEQLTVPWPGIADGTYPLSVTHLADVPSQVGKLATKWKELVGKDVIYPTASVENQATLHVV